MSKKSNFKFYWKCQRACYLLKITIILDFSIFKFSSCWDFNSFSYLRGFPDCPSDKKSACQYWRHTRLEFNPWVRKIWWRRKWQPTSLFLPGKFHGQRSLLGYSPGMCKELDMTGHTHTHTHTCNYYVPENVSCIRDTKVKVFSIMELAWMQTYI